MFESGVEDQPRSANTQEVFNYIRALQAGFKLLDEIPISTRLMCEMHKVLLMRLPRSRRGSLAPGEYRQDQNFIGKSRDIAKSRFNPPPPPVHIQCMSALEKAINQEDMYNIPLLVFLSLVHYQFETIHPFPDGNGRVGRLLIPIILKTRRSMPEPLLYLSQYLEDEKDRYVDLMLDVSQTGRWIEWIEFFLTGIVVSCDKTMDTIRRVRSLHEDYKKRCQKARSSVLLLQIVDSLLDKLIVTVPQVRDMTNTSYTAAQHNVQKLIEYGILKEAEYSMRPKFYFATELMEIFES
jgi:Fic family protein